MTTGRPDVALASEYVAQLQRFTAAVSAAVRMKDVARILFEQGLEQFGARGVGIVWMMRPRELDLVFGRGVTEREFRDLDALARQGERLPIRDAIVGRHSVWLDTPEQIREQYPVLEPLRARRGESGLAVVPLVVGEHCPGVIGFTFVRAAPFTETDRSFIEMLAWVSAQAFERARLYEAEQAARLEAERVGTIQHQLMAIVGHDLRTPLSSIVISSDILLERGSLTPEYAKLVRRIRASASRMGVIIRDLVDFGRARQGMGIGVSLRASDLAELTGEAIAELGEAEERRVVLEVAGDTSLECDPGRMLQVASNLLANALRHGGGASVRVSVEGDGEEVVLTVHNDGPPIPSDLLPHVFEPFRQGVESGIQPHAGSTGLGLFIVREIVAAHRGTVAVASDAASGTLLTVRLPRVAPTR